VGHRAGERARLELGREVDQLVALVRREAAGSADELRGAPAIRGRERAKMAAGQQRELQDGDDLEER